MDTTVCSHTESSAGYTQAELKGEIIYTPHTSYRSADESQKPDWDSQGPQQQQQKIGE